MSEKHLDQSSAPPDWFFSPAEEDKERCGLVMISSYLWQTLTPRPLPRACPGKVVGKAEHSFRPTEFRRRAVDAEVAASRGSQSSEEVGALTLPGAGLQFLHAVHGEPAHPSAHGALLPFALVVTLLRPDAHRWESVPTVALSPGLQASVDVGPAGRAGPGVSPKPGPGH